MKLARVQDGLVSGFAYLFFEFRGRGRVLVRGRVETNVLLEHVHANEQRSLWSLVVHVRFSQLPRFTSLFHLCKVFFVSRLERLELKFKFQRALRPMKEEAKS